MNAAPYTRADYMRAPFASREDMAQRHRRYYAQMVSPAVIARVVSTIGADALKRSRCDSFNDIPLERWDRLAHNLGPLPVSFESLGDYATLGGLVCVAKEAARQYVEANA